MLLQILIYVSMNVSIRDDFRTLIFASAIVYRYELIKVFGLARKGVNEYA